mgnify:CR=1 FL=1
MAKRKAILAAVHKTARGLHDAGLMNARTLREFDVLCLPRIKEYSAAQIKRIREQNKASQAVFAAYLNTSVSTVQKWERGEVKPQAAALKLLNLAVKGGLEAIKG